jgi:hypothetical protein
MEACGNTLGHKIYLSSSEKREREREREAVIRNEVSNYATLAM